MNSKLKAGTLFNKSAVGHKEFLYPTHETDTLIVDTVCDVKPFVGGGQLVAVTVPEDVIRHDGRNDVKVVIWVEKKNIVREYSECSAVW